MYKALTVKRASKLQRTCVKSTVYSIMKINLFLLSFNQKTAEYEKQLEELKASLNTAKLSASEAEQNLHNLQEKEASAKTRHDKVQRDLDELRMDSRRKISQLQEDKDDAEAQLKTYKNRCNVREDFSYLYLFIEHELILCV